MVVVASVEAGAAVVATTESGGAGDVVGAADVVAAADVGGAVEAAVFATSVFVVSAVVVAAILELLLHAANSASAVTPATMLDPHLRTLIVRLSFVRRHAADAHRTSRP